MPVSPTLTPRIQPRFLRPLDAAAYSSLSRSTLYALMAAGKIRSVSNKQEGKRFGARLIDRLSLDSYLDSLGTEGPPSPRPTA